MIAEGLFAKDGKLFVMVSITEWDKRGNLPLAPSLDRESDTLLPKNTESTGRDQSDDLNLHQPSRQKCIP
jgi:hypothetical protein